MSSVGLVVAVRASLGLSQRLFANRLGVRAATVNRWERGHAEPSRLAWLAMRGLGLPGALDVQISALLEQKGYHGVSVGVAATDDGEGADP